MYQPDKFADLLPSKPSYFPEPDAAGRILLEAAHAIRTRGHAKHGLTNESGGLCLTGAINVALYGHHTFRAERKTLPLTGRVADVLRLLGGERDVALRHSAAVYWNNAPERTPAEVISALEAAAFYSEPVPA